MTTTFASPGRLTDGELLARVHCLARDEREATATLVAHLAELDERRLYLNEGFSSLFAYCTRALHYAEGAAYNRIEAARAGREFPVVFEMLAAGDLHLTAIRLLRPHLTEESHRELLARARHRTKREIQELIAGIRPRPDVPTLVRRLPARREESGIATDLLAGLENGGVAAAPGTPPPPAPVRPASPILAPLSPDRYRIQFTASREMYARLQELRDLLRHRIPDGDPAQILDEALIALLEKVKKQKLATVQRPRESRRSDRAAAVPRGERISAHSESGMSRSADSTRPRASRHIPADVKREVWTRDQGQCAFRSPGGRRCGERGRLEFHHLEPFAVGGAAIADNIALRCAAHNRHEAELCLSRATVRNARAFSERKSERDSAHGELQSATLTRSGPS